MVSLLEPINTFPGNKYTTTELAKKKKFNIPVDKDHQE